MRNIKIFQNTDISSVKLAAISALEECLIKNKNKEILLLLSGGSAFSLLTLNKKYFTNHLTIGVLDERYSTNPHINNFHQLSDTSFFKTAKENGCTFIDTGVNVNESMQDLAFRFEKELKLWKDNNLEGVIVITQGMGADGHTSGIIPFPEDKFLFCTQFENENKWVVGYDAGKKNPYPLRVTTTIPFLKEVDISIMYVAGNEKKDVLKKVLLENTPLHIFPATVIKEMKKVLLFTDIVIK